MGYANRRYDARIIDNEYILPSESVWSGIIFTSNSVRIALQISAVADSGNYEVGANSLQEIHVSIYPIYYEDVMDTTPVMSKTVSAQLKEGDNGSLEARATVFFDVPAIHSMKIQFYNPNDWGVWLTVRMSTAEVE